MTQKCVHSFNKNLYQRLKCTIYNREGTSKSVLYNIEFFPIDCKSVLQRTFVVFEGPDGGAAGGSIESLSDGVDGWKETKGTGKVGESGLLSRRERLRDRDDSIF